MRVLPLLLALASAPGVLAQESQPRRDPAIGVFILVFFILFYFWYSQRK